MEMLLKIARWETIMLLVGFGGVTGWKLFHTASFAGLLRAPDGTLSPGRMQLLVLTIMTAIYYLLTTIHSPKEMPAIPKELVIALGGSQGVYLGTKAWNILGSKQK